MARFNWLEKLELTAAGLILDVSKLLPGQPDGVIGVPLLVTEKSEHFRVHFQRVGAFRLVPEPFNQVSDRAEEHCDFLLQENASDYLSEMTDAARFAAGIPSGGTLLHFIVYTENHVVHVLTAQKPSITSVSAVGP